MHFLAQVFAEILAAIIRHQQGEAENINALIICGINADLAEIKWTWIHGAHARPFFSSVVGSKNATGLTAQIIQPAKSSFVTLHDCHEDPRVCCADGQTYAAGLSGQTAAKFLPTRATVGALENSPDIFPASHAEAGSETPWCALSRIKRRINCLPVRWIEHHIATSSARVVWSSCFQNQFPCFARIRGLEQSAFAAIRPEVAHCSGVGDVRFFGIDNNPSNGTAVFQSDVLPLLSAIGRPINTIAPARRIPIVGF